MGDVHRRAYSVREVAKLWGTSPKQIYRMIEDGKLQAFSVGINKGLRITTEEVARCESASAATTPIESEDAPSDGSPTAHLSPSIARALLAAG